MTNIKPTSPVMLGICSQTALDDALAKASRVAERRRKEAERAQRRAEREKAAAKDAREKDAREKAAADAAAADAAADGFRRGRRARAAGRAGAGRRRRRQHDRPETGAQLRRCASRSRAARFSAPSVASV
jgi:hypothetical protein